MNCENCGAAMELVESRRYFRCRHCGAYHFSESVEADGIRIVGHVADGLKCPVCATMMARAVLDGQNPIDFCAKCRGILLPRDTFADVTSTRRAWASSPPADPVPLDREALTRALRCPKCSGRFETHPTYGPGNAVIDSCVKCDLIWLDFGELRQIVDAPGKDRGSRRLIANENEYAALGLRPDEDPDQESASRRQRGWLGFLIDLMLEN